MGPYLALAHYVPKYKQAKADIVELNGRVLKLTAVNTELEAARFACNKATQDMIDASKQAELKRQDAEFLARENADRRDVRIIDLKTELKVPTNAKTECTQLKDIIDRYTSDTYIRLRTDPKSGTGVSSGTYTGKVRERQPEAPSEVQSR